MSLHSQRAEACNKDGKRAGEGEREGATGARVSETAWALTLPSLRRCCQCLPEHDLQKHLSRQAGKVQEQPCSVKGIHCNMSLTNKCCPSQLHRVEREYLHSIEIVSLLGRAQGFCATPEQAVLPSSKF